MIRNLQAQTEIERYKAEREKAFKDNETKNVGSKDDIAAKIEADTKVKIEAMNRSVASNKEVVIQSLLSLCCDIKPEVNPTQIPQNTKVLCSSSIGAQELPCSPWSLNGRTEDLIVLINSLITNICVLDLRCYLKDSK